MRGKRVLEFVLLKPAFSSRNLTSLLLVAIFFGVYVLAGGKVEVPDVKQGANFGTVTKNGSRSGPTEESARFKPSPEREVAEQKLQPESSTEKFSNEQNQKLRELEERLKGLRRRTGAE